MTIFTVHFRSNADAALDEIEADTPAQALTKAQELHKADPLKLLFEPYDGLPVNEIAIEDEEGNEVAVWLDDSLRLELAARDLLNALEQALKALNTAPRFAVPSLETDSYQIAALCDKAITKAKGGAS